MEPGSKEDAVLDRAMREDLKLREMYLEGTVAVMSRVLESMVGDGVLNVRN